MRTYKHVSIVPCQSSEELVGISAPDAEASKITSPEFVPREGEAVEWLIIVNDSQIELRTTKSMTNEMKTFRILFSTIILQFEIKSIDPHNFGAVELQLLHRHIFGHLGI